MNTKEITKRTEIVLKKRKEMSWGQNIMIAMLVFVCAIIISLLTRILLTWQLVFLPVGAADVDLIASIVDGVVAAIAAALVICELRHSSNTEESKKDIEEAQFILQYNQAFIQDENMVEVERILERTMEGACKGPIITEESRQRFINYLVYLEGLAPLILRGVLQLEHIDDLFAYRFFLAVNNKELQDSELKKFPEYYRGCFKVYKLWKQYRVNSGLPILQEENSLDKWSDFKRYAEQPIKVRKVEPNDDRKTIAALIYGTDPYIYPAAFCSERKGKRIISSLLDGEKTLFDIRNLRVALIQEQIVGISLILDKVPEEIYSGPKLHVCRNYFNKISGYFDADNMVYIACISVDPKLQGKGVGEALLREAMQEFNGRKMKLHVLCDNKRAIALYEKFGFNHGGVEMDGYARRGSAPRCYEMIRDIKHID